MEIRFLNVTIEKMDNGYMVSVIMHESSKLSNGESKMYTPNLSQALAELEQLCINIRTKMENEDDERRSISTE